MKKKTDAYIFKFKTGNFPTGVTQETLDAEINKREGEILDYQKALSAGTKGGFTGVAFVSFNTERMKEELVTRYKTRALERFRIAFFGKKHAAGLMFHDQKLYLSQAAEPGDIYWENLHLSDKETYIRKFGGIIFTFGLLILCGCLIFYMTGQQSSSTTTTTTTTVANFSSTITSNDTTAATTTDTSTATANDTSDTTATTTDTSADATRLLAVKTHKSNSNKIQMHFGETTDSTDTSTSTDSSTSTDTATTESATTDSATTYTATTDSSTTVNDSSTDNTTANESSTDNSTTASTETIAADSTATSSDDGSTSTTLLTYFLAFMIVVINKGLCFTIPHVAG